MFYNFTVCKDEIQDKQEEKISLPILNYYANFVNDELTSEQLTDQGIIFPLNNQLEEPKEDDIREEEDLSISSVLNAVKISNFMALNNVSSKTNFKK